ncbi:MAG: hypothetical protein RRA94_06460, partial [Bacteroidota bacterium]|nr:hypothetical protein [Bacteroidota bacterium]
MDTTLARTALADSIRYHYLTQKQFALVRELGLNLISVLMDPDEVRRDTITTNRNPVAEVSAAAINGTDTIDLIIRDWVAEDYLHGYLSPCRSHLARLCVLGGSQPAR